MARVTRTVGPKGQITIPKEIRDRAGLAAGAEVLVELRGSEVVLKRVSPPTGSYVGYFVSTYADKVKDRVHVKKIIEDEVADRNRLR